MNKKCILIASALSLMLAVVSCGSSELKSIEHNETIESFDCEKSLSKADIEYLLKAAMAAPVARNVAVWNFYVVEGENMQKIAGAIGNDKDAPAAIVVCGNEAKFMGGQSRHFWTQDCTAATENILIAAKSKGLAAEWVRVYPLAVRVDAVKKALNLKPGQIPFAIILIGNAKSTVEIPSRYNESLVTWL